jgi:hypothetical protein
MALSVFVLAPIAFLWAINTLGFPVAYTFKTWLASVVILSLMAGSGASVRKGS